MRTVAKIEGGDDTDTMMNMMMMMADDNFFLGRMKPRITHIKKTANSHRLSVDQ